MGRIRQRELVKQQYKATAEGIAIERAMRASCRFYQYFPETGPLRRGLYGKHLAFMRAGKEWKQRAALMGNRSGKTDIAAYEITCHLTGQYPSWWAGRVFEGPGEWWAAGDTAGTTRDIIQVAFLGPTSTIESREWCGMLPRSMVYDVARKPGVPLAVSTIWVRHASGGMSSLDLKCHPAGSRVLMSDGSCEQIEKIRLGMRVRCPDGVVRPVTQRHAYRQAPVLEIATRGGRIQATGNHPMFTTNRGQVLAEDIVAGDVLEEVWFEPARPKGPTGEVLLVEDVGRKDVFCVGVDDVHELIVEGYRVGNSFDQKRESFQGTAKAGCWLDEEPPEDVYAECLMRTMTTNGLMLVTFTPLQGLTPFIASWLERSMVEVLDERGGSQLRPAKAEVFQGIETAERPNEADFAGGEVPKDERGTRYIVMASWDEAPHLSAEQKTAMLLEFPVHQRDARSKGIPALGSGVIYPIPEGDIKVSPFEIPESWPRAFGMDIDAGAGWTAAVWGAHDRTSNVYYLYDVYKRSHAEPVIHATAIKARGAWIPGVADAAALMVTAHDSEQMLSVYRNLGLNVVLPNKAPEANIFKVWELFSSGRLKVFASCGAFFEEFRLYRRDGKGRIVKHFDHVMDAAQYLVVSGFPRAVTKPIGKELSETYRGIAEASSRWMQ